MKALINLSIIATLSITIACSATKKLPAWTPVGNWDYTVEDTPMGNVDGVMMITQEGDMFKIKLSSSQGSIDMSDVSIVDKALKAKFAFDGNPMEMDGSFTEEGFTGAILSNFGNFPVTATKKMD